MKRYEQQRASEHPADARAYARDGMIDQLAESLNWALQEIRERSTGEDANGTPEHLCEFVTAPDRGKCDFHEKYWTAKQLLEGAGY